ncbi:MAG: coproporphyrinogen III oxidase [candidate division BRC1 bacterium ADurb.BinA292]|nr:MAG: coproporphyrinogen III oxidase [candidate division BRC1 bacterium ADurb.BinA292]
MLGQPCQRVFCIVPPTGRYIREDRCQTPIEKMKTIALRPPIDLMYAAGSFEAAGAEVRLTDYPGEQWGWDRLEQDLREFQPDAILLSITTPSLDQDMEAAALAKRVDPKIVTMAKGAHFNTRDVQTLEQYAALDVVFRGEYEQTCAELARGAAPASILGITWRDTDGAVQRNGDRPFTDDLDAIPFPARHLTHNELYIRPDTMEVQTTIITNRGCPFHCIYCLANQVSGTKNRYRSVENVVAEIRQCVERHGIRNFLFRSDLFTQNKKWVIELCQAIIEAGLDIQWASNSRVDTVNPEVLGWMRKAGCWIIALGVESGDQETLDRIQKKATVAQAFQAVRWIREAGIKSSVYLLMGLPWDTPETIERQMAFARELDPDILEIFYPYPFPGTALYDLCVKQGLIREGEIPRDAYSDPATGGLYMSVDDFKRLRKQAIRDFYLRPSKIIRTLRGAPTLGEKINYIKAGVRELFSHA